MKTYFIGIVGKAMAPLAKALKDMGWEVSGSDHDKVYPPLTTYLEKNEIQFTKGFSEENVPKDAKLIILGRSALMMNKNNPEYLMVKNMGIPIMSYPEVLNKYLIKKNSIVIAGTYGKTTISALISWILINAGKNPSYMIGGSPKNLDDGIKINNSDWSVVEGDETPDLFEDGKPKFMFYKPKYLIITATEYDHPEIFKSKDDYINAYVNLVNLLPKDGLLVYNLDNVDSKVIESCKCKKISFSSKNIKVDYFVNNVVSKIKTNLIGEHNLENICAAYALCLSIGINEKDIIQGISSFKGIVNRLEYLGIFMGRYLYSDFAQHPLKIKSTIQALRDHYGKKRIICVFDPSMTGLKYQESLSWYPGAFDSSDQVIVGKVGFLKGLKGNERVTGNDIVESIKKTNDNVFYEPIDENIQKYLIESTKEDDVIVFMSSGGLRFTNLIQDTIKKLTD